MRRLERGASWSGQFRRLRSLLTMTLLCGAGQLPAAAQVTLPLERYEDLRSRARTVEEPPAVPSAPWATQDVGLELEVGESSAKLVTTWRVSMFTDEWQSIGFVPSGSIVAADFGGLEGRVDASSGWSLRVRGRGEHSVRLESVVPVERDASATRPTWRLVLQVPRAAAVHGRLLAPALIEDASVEGAGWIQRSPAPAQPAAPSAWDLLARPGSSLTITLAGKATTPQRALLPLRFEASSATTVALSRTQTKLRAWIEARVLQGRLDELRIPLPAGFEVAAVNGAVSGWKTEDGILVVTPPAPVESNWPLTVDLTGAAVTAFASPLLLPSGAVRVTALCSASVKGDGLVTLADAGSARALEEGEQQRLPGGLRAAGERLYAVRDPQRPPHFEITWAEGTEVLAAQIDRLLIEVLLGEAGHASYRVWAEVRNRGAQEMVFDLPAGFELAAAARDQAEVRAGLSGTAFSLPLAASERVQVLRLAGVLPLALPAAGDLAVPLPRLSAPAARIEVRVLLPLGRTYTLVDANRAGRVGPASEIEVAVAPAENAAQQAVLASLRAVPADALFPLPPGYTELDASWNALTATPPALVLRLKAKKEDTPWF